MTMDLTGYDANQHEPAVGGGGGPVPAGDYLCIISASEETQNSLSNGSHLKIEFEIVEGDNKGRKIFGRLNLKHEKEQVRLIAMRELSAICHAVGVLTPRASSDLHNRPLVVSVVTKPRSDDPNKMGNEITGYAPRGGGSPALQQQFGSAPAQAPQQTGFGQQQAAAAPAAAGSPAPWQRRG